MSAEAPRTWFVTGAGGGLGFHIICEAAARGEKVYGLVRSEKHAEKLAAQPGDIRPLLGDVTRADQITAHVSSIEAETAGVDVAVNNAGYGLIGAIEEVSTEELRAQLEVNLFGAFHVLKAVLPGMRARRAGRILNVTSVSGHAAWGGTGAYTTSKFALEGLGQTLQAEVAELGIKVTNVAPGGLRTAFGAASLRKAAQTIDDYDGAGHAPSRVYAATSGQEPSDPALAARAIFEISRSREPPMHLLLGADALKYLDAAQDQLAQDLETHKALTLGVACKE
ncbi:MAG: SDR family NAD(P)-dependent oxidoreductase [Pseudomonadota bacterium]